MNAGAPAGATTPEHAAPATPRWRSRAAVVALGIWAAVGIVVIASLMVGHLYVLPRPQRADAVLEAGIDSLRGTGEQQRWMAVHVLYSECRCSRAILDHLFSSARPGGVVEKIVLVGRHEEFARRGREAGFVVEVVTKDELGTRFHLEAAPLLVVAAPDGRVRHVGGYTEHKQGLDYRDVTVIEELMARGEARELPLFGCAVARELQRLLDPVGVKYSRAD